jgi:DTW domain-containing protein YfiP
VSNIKHHAKRETPRPQAKPSAPKGRNASPFKTLLDVLKEEAVVLPGEDLRAYEDLRLGFFHDFSPQNPLEEQRVLVLVDTAWRKKRCFALENSLFAPQYAAPPADREAASKLLTEQIKAMDKISRHEARLSRLWDATWNDLRKMQADRKKGRQMPIMHLVQ